VMLGGSVEDVPLLGLRSWTAFRTRRLLAERDREGVRMAAGTFACGLLAAASVSELRSGAVFSAFGGLLTYNVYRHLRIGILIPRAHGLTCVGADKRAAEWRRLRRRLLFDALAAQLGRSADATDARVGPTEGRQGCDRQGTMDMLLASGADSWAARRGRQA
jgi:hypothetical protein